MAKLSYKLSYYVFYAVVAVIVVCFLLFFLVGFGNIDPTYSSDYNSPACTDVILILMIVLTVIGALLVVWSGINSAKESSGSDAQAINGVPANKIGYFSVGVMFLSIIIGLVCNLGEPAFTAADGTVTSGALVTMTDMFLWSMSILLIIAALAMVVNMSGILKK
jgi:magnesium-transporting ATPase (P-type)